MFIVISYLCKLVNILQEYFFNNIAVAMSLLCMQSVRVRGNIVFSIHQYAQRHVVSSIAIFLFGRNELIIVIIL